MSKWFVTLVLIVVLVTSTGIGFWMFSEAKAELDNIKVELANTRAIQATLENTRGELADTQAELDDTKDELIETKAELLDIRNELTSTRNSLSEVTYELNQIRDFYPPRHFATLGELRDWMDEHTPFADGTYSLYETNLKIQEEALADGFIWSVYYGRDNRVISVVKAGDSIYYCWPEGDIEWITDL